MTLTDKQKEQNKQFILRNIEQFIVDDYGNFYNLGYMQGEEVENNKVERNYFASGAVPSEDYEWLKSKVEGARIERERRRSEQRIQTERRERKWKNLNNQATEAVFWGVIGYTFWYFFRPFYGL